MTPYDQLVLELVRSGVSRTEAEPAVRRCLGSMSKHAVAAYGAGGLLAYFLNANPVSAFGYAVLTIGVGAGYALDSSPSCSALRQAIRFWSCLDLQAPFRRVYSLRSNTTCTRRFTA